MTLRWTYVGEIEGFYQVPCTSAVLVDVSTLPPGTATFDSKRDAEQAMGRRCDEKPGYLEGR